MDVSAEHFFWRIAKYITPIKSAVVQSIIKIICVGIGGLRDCRVHGFLISAVVWILKKVLQKSNK
ncbi:hypothetical protein ACHAXS_006291 [Conticribra weissflogii]